MAIKGIKMNIMYDTLDKALIHYQPYHFRKGRSQGMLMKKKGGHLLYAIL